MKILIYLIIGLLFVGIASADITCSETIDRNVPATASGDFSITYTAGGTSGAWGASITDTVSGGCLFPNGQSTYSTVMLSEDGNTKTTTITAPASGTCTFANGDYMFGTCSLGTFADDTITIGATTCVYSSWSDGACGGGTCATTERQQTRTVTSGTGCTATTQCVTDATCGTCDVTAWVNDVCGGGTCTSTEMRQTRTATPSGCLSESQCIASTACDTTTPTTLDCDWYEKEKAGACEMNTGVFILIGIGLFAFKIFGG